MGGFLAPLPAISVGYLAEPAAAALVLGAAIGLERQWPQCTARPHANTLVALDAARFELFAILVQVPSLGVTPIRATVPGSRPAVSARGARQINDQPERLCR